MLAVAEEEVHWPNFRSSWIEKVPIPARGPIGGVALYPQFGSEVFLSEAALWISEYFWLWLFLEEYGPVADEEKADFVLGLHLLLDGVEKLLEFLDVLRDIAVMIGGVGCYDAKEVEKLTQLDMPLWMLRERLSMPIFC